MNFTTLFLVSGLRNYPELFESLENLERDSLINLKQDSNVTGISIFPRLDFLAQFGNSQLSRDTQLYRMSSLIRDLDFPTPLDM